MNQPLTERQKAFLDAYRVTGRVKAAAAQTGCSRELHYGALRASESYRAEFSLVQQRLADELGEELWQRAVYGVKVPKFYRGEVIGYEIRYSDTLLMTLLEARDPEKFGGIRQELQRQSREEDLGVWWDRDEVARPTLPRMTGPMPPAPPRPPRPPLPSPSECGVPVTYAEWAAARGITGTADCGPVDQEKLQRWAAGGDGSPIEWVPEEAAMDLADDDADTDLCQVGVARSNEPESDDSDVDFCVGWDADEPDGLGDGSALQASETMFARATRPGGPGWDTGWPFRPEERSERTETPECQVGSRWSAGRSQGENAATVGRVPVRKRLRRGLACHRGRPPAPRLALGASSASSDVPPRPSAEPPGRVTQSSHVASVRGLWSAAKLCRFPSPTHWRRSFLSATHRDSPPRSSGTLAVRRV